MNPPLKVYEFADPNLGGRSNTTPQRDASTCAPRTSSVLSRVNAAIRALTVTNPTLSVAHYTCPVLVGPITRTRLREFCDNRAGVYA